MRGTAICYLSLVIEIPSLSIPGQRRVDTPLVDDWVGLKAFLNIFETLSVLDNFLSIRQMLALPTKLSLAKGF